SAHPESPTPLPVVVSARSPGALQEAVARAAAHLASVDESDFYDVAYTATRRRAAHRHRAVVLATSATQAAQSLSTLYGDTPRDSSPVSGDTPPDASPKAGVGEAARSSTPKTTVEATPSSPTPKAVVGQAARSSTPKTAIGDTPSNPSAKAVIGEAVERGRVALVFCGNGSQWAGMGADLLGEPAFRKAVEAVDGELVNRLGWSVLEELTLPPDRWRLSATERAQPLLFAVQAGLAAMLEAAGVRAGAVLGHSVGEVAAAYVSGALSPEQAAQVIAERSLAQAM